MGGKTRLVRQFFPIVLFLLLATQAWALPTGLVITPASTLKLSTNPVSLGGGTPAQQTAYVAAWIDITGTTETLQTAAGTLSPPTISVTLIPSGGTATHVLVYLSVRNNACGGCATQEAILQLGSNNLWRVSLQQGDWLAYTGVASPAVLNSDGETKVTGGGSGGGTVDQGNPALFGDAWPVTLASSGLEIGIPGNPLVVSVDGSVTTGGLTDAELRASPVPVSGPLTDTELRATPVPVSGPLTDTQLRASPVPVNGTIAATQSGTWTVQPGNTANTTPWLVDGREAVASASNDGACVSVTSASSTVLASSSTRRAFTLVAVSTNSATIFVKFASGSATTGDFPLIPGAAYGMPIGNALYTGEINAVTALASLSLCLVAF